MSNRRAKGSGSVYKKTVVRGAKTYQFWEGQVTYYDRITGKQKRKTITAKTQADCVAKLNTAAAEMQVIDYSEPTRLTVGEWLDTWLEDFTGNIKPLTLKHYRAQVKTHIKPAFKDVKLTKLNTLQVQAFYNQLGKTGHKLIDKEKKTVKYEPLSAKSIKNIHGILSKALSVAVDLGYIQVNPCDKAKLPRIEKKEIQPLTDEQVQAFFKEAANDEYSYLLQILPFTGMREGEALGLTWDCVDFETGTITINKQLIRLPKEQGGYRLAETKSSKTRIIQPASTVMALLKKCKAQQELNSKVYSDYWEGWKTEEEHKKYFCFTDKLGHHLSPKTVYKHCKEIFSNIGCPEERVHDLRHTFAVLSLQNGDDVRTVQENLGHATASFTLDVYCHVSDRMRKESSNRMQQYIEKMA